MGDTKLINDYLGTFGKNPGGEPLFRLSFTDDCRELRTATYEVYYGKIYLRTERATKSVSKYPHLKGHWVIEQWFPPNITYSDDLPESKDGRYEIRYVYPKGLPVIKRVAEIVMQAILKPAKSSDAIKSAIKDEMDEAEKKENKEIDDSIELRSDIQSLLHFREGVAYTGDLKNVPDWRKR